MENDIKYIQENYVEWEDLCKLSNITSQELKELIQRQLIPNASYTIHLTEEISSPLQDSIIIKNTKKYFPENVVDLIERNRRLKNTDDFKPTLKSEFFDAFMNSKDNEYAYGNILNEDGSIDLNKLNAEFEQEWKHYCQGIYGICTLNASGADIAKKEIAVKKLIRFNEQNEGKKLDEVQVEELKSLNKEFNSVSNLFAPYQRKNSSRGKYLDKILESNSLDELIKKYH